MPRPLPRVPPADPGARRARAGGCTGSHRTGRIAPGDAPVSIALRFAACPDRIRAALRQVRRHLAARGLSDDRLGTVELALAEALNNIAEHAYAGQGAGPVSLVARGDGDGLLRVVLRDRGRALPGNRLPDGTLPTLDTAPHALPEGGFGWFLIRDLADRVDYTRVGGTNRLILHFATP